MVTVLGLLLCLIGVVALLPTGNSSMWGGTGKASLRSMLVLSLVRGGDRCGDTGALVAQRSLLWV